MASMQTLGVTGLFRPTLGSFDVPMFLRRRFFWSLESLDNNGEGFRKLPTLFMDDGVHNTATTHMLTDALWDTRGGRGLV